MPNIKNDNNNGFVRDDCEISAADVARAEVFPKNTHGNDKGGKTPEDVERLNSHLRDSECGADRDCGHCSLPSPSEAADPSCRGNSLLECGVDVFAETETYEKERTLPTNPDYKMIDPSDDSADTAKS